MAALSPITRYKLRKLIKYGLVTVAAAAVFMLFSGEGGKGYFAAWALLGIWTGVLEEFLFGRRFRSLAIPLQFLGKAVAVNLLTMAFIAFAFLINSENVLPLGDVGPRDVVAARAFYRIILQVMVVTSIAILVVQVEELMGRRLFTGFMLGRYERPVDEERVVLCIDLVGSTALNERLGDLRYFRFLNTTHSLMTDAVLHNEAEIHKYIGDEVIFTWTMRGGIRHLNCLDLFFDIEERIAEHEVELLREFGVVPRFRGAVHGGRVITAQVGHIKRAIDFSGDTMNTVSRLLNRSKEMKAGILVSSELLERMPDAAERFRFGPELELPVKGKKRSVQAREVERIKRG
ncbi:MAG TPA: adenylate/guanylate cyclase domain-containing protein [Flavobacteriales bacterium]